MQSFILVLDLKDDPELIAQYDLHHQNIWPEVYQHLCAAGIIDMRIYRFRNRLVMQVQAEDSFSWEKLGTSAEQNPKIMAWEALMDTYQARFPAAQGKWQLAEQIFALHDNHAGSAAADCANS